MQSIIIFQDKGNLVSGLSLRDFHAKDDNIELLDLNSQLSDYKFPIDIVVVIDQSASMVDNIQDFKNNISKFLKLLESVNVDWRLGLVVYGDKITNKSELGKELSTFLDNFPKSLTGGAEIAEDALYSLTSFNFRPAAQKVAILCTDELVFQGFSEIEDCNMIQSLIHKGIRVFQALPPDNRNSEFLSILTRGKIYNLYDKFETILPAIGHYLTNFYYINYYEIPKNQKRQMDIDIDKGNVDLQKYRINPFPLGYYKPFIKKNLLNYQRWLKINPNLNSASKLNKEYSKIIKDEKTQVHLQYILDGVADKISDYLYDLNESDSKKSKLIIELTGFTDNLQVHSLQNIDDYLILEGKEIGLRYGSNKELAYLRAYHTWKDLRELIMQKDPNDYFSKLLAQNRIIINYTYFYPDGRNPRLESDSKDLDIKHLRKVIIKYWKEK